MTDIPAIFTAPMVLALLDGRKTETRRMLYGWRKASRVSPGFEIVYGTFADGTKQTYWPVGLPSPKHVPVPSRWPKVKAGDRIWVRENCRAVEEGSRCGVLYPAGADIAWAVAGRGGRGGYDERQAQLDRWRHLFQYGRRAEGRAVPAIHMPRWASRLTLIVTATRIERLWAITNEAAKAEGVTPSQMYEGTISAHRVAFANLWLSINGAASWDANPWVVVVQFQVKHANIDKLGDSADGRPEQATTAVVG